MGVIARFTKPCRIELEFESSFLGNKEASQRIYYCISIGRVQFCMWRFKKSQSYSGKQGKDSLTMPTDQLLGWTKSDPVNRP